MRATCPKVGKSKYQKKKETNKEKKLSVAAVTPPPSIALKQCDTLSKIRYGEVILVEYRNVEVNDIIGGKIGSIGREMNIQ